MKVFFGKLYAKPVQHVLRTELNLSIFFTNSAIVSPSCSPRYVFPLRTGIEVGLINPSCVSLSCRRLKLQV